VPAWLYFARSSTGSGLLISEGSILGHIGVDIDIPLTQQELASLIASSRESIVRSLRSLRARRLIATGRRRITIRDLDDCGKPTISERS
jgi:CRP-like cAMP-binding protein